MPTPCIISLLIRCLIKSFVRVAEVPHDPPQVSQNTQERFSSNCQQRRKQPLFTGA